MPRQSTVEIILRKHSTLNYDRLLGYFFVSLDSKVFLPVSKYAALKKEYIYNLLFLTENLC